MNIEEIAEEICSSRGQYVIDSDNYYYDVINKLENYDYVFLCDAVQQKGKTLYWNVWTDKFVVE